MLASCSRLGRTNPDFSVNIFVSLLILGAVYSHYSKKVRLNAWTRFIIYYHFFTYSLFVISDVSSIWIESGSYAYFKGMTNIFFLVTLQFLYFTFGLKMMIIEAQMPLEGRTIMEIYKKVARTVYFWRLCIIFFIFYQVFKLVSSFILSPLGIGDSIQWFMIWSSAFGIYCFLKMLLWGHFWYLSNRFCYYIQIQSKWVRVVTAVFFNFHIFFNISGGIIQNLLIYFNMQRLQPCQPWQSILNHVNNNVFLATMTLDAIVILLVFSKIGAMGENTHPHPALEDHCSDDLSHNINNDLFDNEEDAAPL